jgi:hypothetical protein
MRLINRLIIKQMKSALCLWWKSLVIIFFAVLEGSHSGHCERFLRWDMTPWSPVNQPTVRKPECNIVVPYFMIGYFVYSATLNVFLLNVDCLTDIPGHRSFRLCDLIMTHSTTGYWEYRLSHMHVSKPLKTNFTFKLIEKIKISVDINISSCKVWGPCQEVTFHIEASPEVDNSTFFRKHLYSLTRLHDRINQKATMKILVSLSAVLEANFVIRK